MARDKATLPDAIVVAASLTVKIPVTNQGCLPISVTYQPANVATQPEKLMATNTLNNHVGKGLSRQSCIRLNQEMVSINIPMPTIIRKAKNTGATGG